jgi:L-lactate dehydrogenase complex protein LldE
MAEPERTAALFVTCLGDLFRPAVAEATARLVGGAGWTVAVPAQGCCGQPNSSSGDGAGAARLAAIAIRRFARYARVVVPSASCAATMRGYPALFPDGSAEQALARDLAARCRARPTSACRAGSAPTGHCGST